MRLEHAFEVPAPIEVVWALLFKLDEIAPCLPGAAAERIDERRYKTSMAVRLGPVQMSYRGELTIAEADVAARRVVLEAKATETRGQGNALAKTTASLTAAGAATRVTLATDLQLTGRVAQMGRGILDDVARHLLDQFVACLTQRFAAAQPAPAVAVEASPTPPSAVSAPAAPALGGFRLLLAVVMGRLRQLLRHLRGATPADRR